MASNIAAVAKSVWSTFTKVKTVIGLVLTLVVLTVLIFFLGSDSASTSQPASSDSLCTLTSLEAPDGIGEKVPCDQVGKRVVNKIEWRSK